MGVLRLRQSPDLESIGGIKKGSIFVVIPLGWMHKLRKDPVLGDDMVLKIILSCLTTYENDYMDKIPWDAYGVLSPDTAAASKSSPKELIGWIDHLVDALTVYARSNEQIHATPSVVRKRLTEIVPYHVLTGWDMAVGIGNWDSIINLLDAAPEIHEIRVESLENNLVMARVKAVDEENTLRVTSIDGWGEKMNYPEGSIENQWTDLLDVITVWPKALYKLVEEKSFYMSINRMVMKG